MQPRHYVLVIHGIGEQQLNETAVAVALRFAEVRAGLRKPQELDRILRTHMSAQSVRRVGSGPGWSEFADIPVDPATAPLHFDGRSPNMHDNGTNFRFVDFGWSALLRKHQERYGVSTRRWTQRLLTEIDHRKDAPDWARPLLHTLRQSGLQLERILWLRSRHLAQLVFRDFLGDIHLYGDYARTRGRAVRDLHVCLDELILRDFVDWCRRTDERGESQPYELPRITMIAHSLGSVLAFDALVYAHMGEDVRRLHSPIEHTCPSLPFPGYPFERDHEASARDELFQNVLETGRCDELRNLLGRPEWRPSALPSILWRDVPMLLVTLGSPIDKYLTLWPGNYMHLTEAELIPERREPILHVNLCDENDPVGHHLGATTSTPVYRKLFRSLNDTVFRRYPWPAVAHTLYWQDTPLFADLLRQIDAWSSGQPLPAPQDLYRSQARNAAAACFIVYFVVPAVCAILLWMLVRGTTDKPWSGMDIMRNVIAMWLLFDPLPLLSRQPPRMGILAAVVFASVFWRRIIMVLSKQHGLPRWTFDLLAVGVLGLGSIAGAAHLLRDGWESLRAGWQLHPILEALWATSAVAFATALSARFLVRRKSNTSAGDEV